MKYLRYKTIKSKAKEMKLVKIEVNNIYIYDILISYIYIKIDQQYHYFILVGKVLC